MNKGNNEGSEQSLIDQLYSLQSQVDILTKQVDQLTGERDELKKQAEPNQQYTDEFALGFAKWIDKGPYMLWGPAMWKSVSNADPQLTDDEIIKLYKESL